MKRVWSGEMLADSEETITVLQWNILAQSLGENGDFCLCPEEALQWEHRRQLLLKVRLVMRALNNVCMYVGNTKSWGRHCVSGGG